MLTCMSPEPTPAATRDPDAPLYDFSSDITVSLPDVFSIHHLVWLNRVGLVLDLPFELGPFPLTLDFNNTGKFDARLESDLVRWGILTDTLDQRTVTLDSGKIVVFPEVNPASIARVILRTENGEVTSLYAAAIEAGVSLAPRGSALGEQINPFDIEVGDLIVGSGVEGIYIGDGSVLVTNRSVKSLDTIACVRDDHGVFRLAAASAVEKHAGGRRLNPEAEFLFNAITGHCAWSLFGVALLYTLKTNAREEFAAHTVGDFGLRHAVRDIPRVPFIIAVTDTEIISAVNAPPALILNRVPRSGDVYKQVGAVLHDLLDPENNWEPWKGKTVTLPFSTMKEMTGNPELSALTDDEDAREAQAKAVKDHLMEADFSSTTSRALAELTSYPLSSSVAVNLNYTTHGGRVTPNVSMGVNFFDGAGVVVSYPVGSNPETRLIYYTPGDAAAFREGVAQLVGVVEDDL